MSELWDIPEGPHRDLPVHVKPDWRGVSARLVGAGLWLLEHLVWLIIVFAAVVFVGLGLPAPAGPVVTVVGGVLMASALLGLRFGVDEWATRVLDDFVQAIDGRIYVQRGRDLDRRPVDQSLLAHEWCHHWQQQQWGKLRYVWGYYVGATFDSERAFRRHAEAMAYALEVAWFGRHPENAARAASRPEYGMDWTPGEARELIERYAERFRQEWGE